MTWIKPDRTWFIIPPSFSNIKEGLQSNQILILSDTLHQTKYKDLKGVSPLGLLQTESNCPKNSKAPNLPIIT